jgi:hypothetical protein
MTAFKRLAPWSATRDRLHHSLQVLAAIPRKYAPPQARWGHIGFKVRQGGFWLDPVPLPDGARLELGLHIEDQAIVMSAGSGPALTWDPARVTPKALATGLFAEAGRLGFKNLDPEKFSGDTDSGFDPEKAVIFYELMVEIDRIFNRHRDRLDGPVTKVQLWPHNFDLAFEWYGGRMVETDGEGSKDKSPAQLNLGWAPGDESMPEPYFYSNPWPFDESLKDKPLPTGASWFDAGWQGSFLPYEPLVDDPAAEERVLEYARAVFGQAYPTLTSG